MKSFKFTKELTALLIVGFLSSGLVYGAGNINGRVTDQEGNPLPFANVVITHEIVNGQELALRSQLGTVTDLNGDYVLSGLEEGRYKLDVIYLGYQSNSASIDVPSDGSVTHNVILENKTMDLEEVVVTMQAKGQMAAINQQVNALTVKNVVSADRIQEIPDANAAEAIGRLPGIMAVRNGGEANSIVVRGMQGFSKTTINGIDVPIDLSAISQYSLQNVEVFKSIDASMDASAPAGTVNLKLGTASNQPKTTLLVQGGYNNLNNHFKNYKINLGSQRRFIDNKLGFSLNLATESTDRSTEQLAATQNIAPRNDTTILQTNSATLRKVSRTVVRHSASLVADYRFSPSASIEWANIITNSPGGALSNSHIYNGAGGGANFSFRDSRDNNQTNYSSILTAKHLLGRIKVDYALAFGYVRVDNRALVASLNADQGFPILSLDQLANLTHKEFVDLAPIDNTPEAMALYRLSNTPAGQIGMRNETNTTNNSSIDARINMELPYRLGTYISGNLKWGARYKSVDYKKENFETNYTNPPFPQMMNGDKIVVLEDGSIYNDKLKIPAEDLSNDGTIMGSYFFDHNAYDDNFLNLGYDFGWDTDMDRIYEVYDWWIDLVNYCKDRGEDYWSQYFIQERHLEKINYNNNARRSIDFSIRHTAAYLMTVMKIGNKINFVPGARFEKYTYDMNAWNIKMDMGSDYKVSGEPTHAVRDHVHVLPMFQLKYEPLPWLSGIASYNKTLKRPSFAVSANSDPHMMPFVYEDVGATSHKAGNPDLKPEQWTNIDIGVAAHGNKIGLFSVTLFYKNVKDKIAAKNWTKLGSDTTYTIGSFEKDQTVHVSEIVNHPYEGVAKGFEVEWQSNFHYLPRPFSYFTINLNYSYINNTTTYLYSEMVSVPIDTIRGRIITRLELYDNVVTGPMQNQPTHVANASLGFSYKKFETHLSYQYMGEVFRSKTIVAATDVYKVAYNRIDFQATYRLPIKGMQLMVNFMNITNTMEKQYRGTAIDRPSLIERYGWAADIGLRYRF